MNIDDQVFSDICSLLDKNDVNYWICHGTLLGIIREKRLLPWDHEIDKKEIVSLFETHGYRQEFIFGDMDCLHFMGESKKIDVSFYKVNHGVASIKWAIAPERLFSKLLIVVASRLVQKNKNEVKKNPSNNLTKKFLLFIIDNFSILLRVFLSKKLKKMMIRSATNTMRYTGYSYPVNMLIIKKMKYNGLSIPIPIDPEACLSETYGENWKIPNKEYIWHQEAKNLVDL